MNTVPHSGTDRTVLLLGVGWGGEGFLPCLNTLLVNTVTHSGTDRAVLLLGWSGVFRCLNTLLVKTLPNSVTDRVSVICIFFKIMMIAIIFTPNSFVHTVSELQDVDMSIQQKDQIFHMFY